MSVAGSRRRLAVDVGGTFIDFVLVDERRGELVIEKQPATPGRLVDELVAGLERLVIPVAEIDSIFHGTTIAINAVVQEAGVRVGLITTEGFRDVLELARGGRAEIYDLFHSTPEPLVERYLRREVRGRIGPDGVELIPLDLDDVAREAERLAGWGVQAIAVCFLHSYANPDHERRSAELIRSRHPDVAVCASAELVGEWREYERTSTAVVNAYVQPILGRYLEDLVTRLGTAGYTRPLAVMQSNGGVIDQRAAGRRPIRTLESGPAGGVIGAHALSRKLGHPNVICADVGGTTYDVALIEDGAILEKHQASIAGRPVLTPMIDIVSIGAGGGSVAWIDHRGVLRVGPRSAGAYPGPAAFGKGGLEPTVTDCQLIAGRLDAARFLGSRMTLDEGAAVEVVERSIAEPLGLSVEAAAVGALAIAETNMAYAIRSVTVERGRDPRDYVMYSYGGGGGLFAASICEQSDIATLVIPRAPANFSAWGILNSDYREDAVVTRVTRFVAGAAAEVAETLADLRAQTAAELEPYGFGADEIESYFRMDVRYAGQDAALSIDVEPAWAADSRALLEGIRERFVVAHRQLYGHGDADAPLELVSCRCRSIARVRETAWPSWSVCEPGKPRSERPVYFHGPGSFVESGIWERDALAVGQEVEGPAIIEEWTTTTLVPPGWLAAVDPIGSLVLTLTGTER